MSSYPNSAPSIYIKNMKEPLLLRRSWWQRSFSKLSPGSMRSSTFALISSALGTGSLSIPLVMKNSGLVLGSVILLVSAWISLLGMNNICRAAEHFRIYDYSVLVSRKLGKSYAIFLELLLAVFLFLCLVAYHLITYNCAEEGFLKLGVDLRPYRLMIKILFTIVVVFPLSLLKKITGASFLSVLGMGSVIYLAVLITAQTYLFIPQNDYFEETKFAVLDMNIISSMCICMYAYICHMNVASIYSEMKSPIIRRMKKTNFRAISFQFWVYLTIGVFGYLSCMEDTPSMIFERQPPSALKSDCLMLVGQILVGLVVFVGFIFTLIPCRQNTNKLLNRMFGFKKISNFRHTAVVFFIVFGSFVLSLYVPEVIKVLEILGAFCPLFCNLLPALLVVKTQKNSFSAYSIGQIVLALAPCFIGAAGVVFEFMT